MTPGDTRMTIAEFTRRKTHERAKLPPRFFIYYNGQRVSKFVPAGKSVEVYFVSAGHVKALATDTIEIHPVR